MSLNIIKKSGEFSHIMKNGLIFYHDLFIIYLLEKNSSIPNQETSFGICVGKKLGIAVQRNKIKRRIREILRHHISYIKPGYSVVIIARSSSKFSSYSSMSAGLITLFKNADILNDLCDSGYEI